MCLSSHPLARWGGMCWTWEQGSLRRSDGVPGGDSAPGRSLCRGRPFPSPAFHSWSENPKGHNPLVLLLQEPARMEGRCLYHPGSVPAIPLVQRDAAPQGEVRALVPNLPATGRGSEGAPRLQPHGLAALRLPPLAETQIGDF